MSKPRACKAIADKMAAKLLQVARAENFTLTTAESCTAGLLGQVLADAPGASVHYQGGFVTYTKQQKARVLGVSGSVLRRRGAVCATVARAMAEGALRRSRADLGAAITGVAGPAADEDGNPVGRVCIAVAARGQLTTDFERNYRDRGRRAIRMRAVTDALDALLKAANSFSATR
jgi:nicotinamide-nucleotide amidase